MTTRPVETLPIQTEDDVAIVRGRVRQLAEQLGFDSFAIAAVTTATSEIARNALIHGRGGVAEIEEVQTDLKTGVRVRISDRGPGISDIGRVLRGGYSTMQSLGLGIAGSRRLVDAFEIDSAPGRGTQVTFTKWKRLP